MSKFIVVSIHRDRWSYPKLTIVVEHRTKTSSAARAFIAGQVMRLYEKRLRGKMGRFPSMRVIEYRVVDELGLKRLQAAAKASVTFRRKRAAKKAAVTRSKNRAVMAPRRLVDPPQYYPAVHDVSVN